MTSQTGQPSKTTRDEFHAKFNFDPKLFVDVSFRWNLLPNVHHRRIIHRRTEIIIVPVGIHSKTSTETEITAATVVALLHHLLERYLLLSRCCFDVPHHMD